MLAVIHDETQKSLIEARVFVDSNDIPHLRNGNGRTECVASLCILDIYQERKDVRRCSVHALDQLSEARPVAVNQRHEFRLRAARWKVFPESINPDDSLLPDCMKASPLNTEVSSDTLNFEASACGGRYIVRYTSQSLRGSDTEEAFHFLIIAARTGLDMMPVFSAELHINPRSMMAMLSNIDTSEYFDFSYRKFHRYSNDMPTWSYNGWFHGIRQGEQRGRFDRMLPLVNSQNIMIRLLGELGMIAQLPGVEDVPPLHGLLFGMRESDTYIFNGRTVECSWKPGGLDQLHQEQGGLRSAGLLPNSPVLQRGARYGRPNPENNLTIRSARIPAGMSLVVYSGYLGGKYREALRQLRNVFPDQVAWLTRFQLNFYISLTFANPTGSRDNYIATQRRFRRREGAFRPGRGYGLGTLLDYLRDYGEANPPPPGTHPSYPLSEIDKFDAQDSSGDFIMSFSEEPLLNLQLKRNRLALAMAANLTTMELHMLRHYYREIGRA